MCLMCFQGKGRKHTCSESSIPLVEEKRPTYQRRTENDCSFLSSNQLVGLSKRKIAVNTDLYGPAPAFAIICYQGQANLGGGVG